VLDYQRLRRGDGCLEGVGWASGQYSASNPPFGWAIKHVAHDSDGLTQAADFFLEGTVDKFEPAANLMLGGQLGVFVVTKEAGPGDFL
jgi:hypothetical protein